MLIGASGSGKSTLLSGLAGLLEGGESEGDLLVDGLDPRTARDRIGIVFQDPQSQLVMSRAGDEVAFGLENRCVPSDAIWPRVGAALEAVGFRYPIARPTDALSGGEQQRLALAAVLALEPGLLLLDEPTANLDPDGAALLGEALDRALAAGQRTMVLVEHRVADSLRLVDRAIVLEAGGGVIADGPPDAIFAERGDELAAAGVWVPGHPLPDRRSRAPGPTTAALEAIAVGYRYPGEPEAAIGPVDLELRSAEALAIAGPNGSGKSTLALLLGGLLRPSHGSVTLRASPPVPEDQPLWRWPAARLARQIGSIFQNPEHQFLTGRVVDELTLAPLRAGLPPAAARARADALLERLHLGALAEANPFTLSGGEKRRLSVATALAADPSVLILDEPTFGQDRRTAIELLDLLAGLRDGGAAICLATHDAPFAAALTDRTVRLEARSGGEQ